MNAELWEFLITFWIERRKSRFFTYHSFGWFLNLRSFLWNASQDTFSGSAFPAQKLSPQRFEQLVQNNRYFKTDFKRSLQKQVGKPAREDGTTCASCIFTYSINNKQSRCVLGLCSWNHPVLQIIRQKPILSNLWLFAEKDCDDFTETLDIYLSAYLFVFSSVQ